MIYSTSISCAALRVRESRMIAGLLLANADPAAWRDAIVERNVLGFRSPLSAQRVASLLRARLESLGAGLWPLVHDGDRRLSTQATMAGAIKHSRLLGDFMDLVIASERTLCATKLERRLWNDYVLACRGRDPEMPLWSDKTNHKMRAMVFQLLADAGYLQDTRSLMLQTVFVDPVLAAFLRERSESYVLRCLEVMG